MLEPRAPARPRCSGRSEHVERAVQVSGRYAGAVPAKMKRLCELIHRASSPCPEPRLAVASAAPLVLGRCVSQKRCPALIRPYRSLSLLSPPPRLLPTPPPPPPPPPRHWHAGDDARFLHPRWLLGPGAVRPLILPAHGRSKAAPAQVCAAQPTRMSHVPSAAQAMR